MSYALNVPAAQYSAVGAASAAFTNPMAMNQLYAFVSSTNCWVAVVATGTAATAAADARQYCYAGQMYILYNPDYQPTAPSATTTTNAFVKTIRDTADGHATLTPLTLIDDL
jgi:hypothetical protein